MSKEQATHPPAPASPVRGQTLPRWLWGALALLVLALVALTLVVGRRIPFRVGVEQNGTSVALADYGQVPEFALVSQTGDSLHLDALRGNVWIADFIFTSCGSICPMMSAQFERLSGQLPPGVRLVSFTVDPERDTPAKLAEYAQRYGATPERWLFLTGDKPQVRRLVTEGFHLGVEEATPEEIAQGAETILHSTRFALVDAGAHIRGYYDGAEAAAVEQLRRDARLLLDGAGPP